MVVWWSGCNQRASSRGRRRKRAVEFYILRFNTYLMHDHYPSLPLDLHQWEGAYRSGLPKQFQEWSQLSKSVVLF